MAACGSLHNIFEKPLPQNPSILKSFSSWNLIEHVKHSNEQQHPSYTEIFGDIHFKENHQIESLLCSSPLPLSSSSSGEIVLPCGIEESFEKEKNDGPDKICRSKSLSSYYSSSGHIKQYKHSDSFSSLNSETLSLCTESLGFESSDDVEDSRNENFFDFHIHEDNNNNNNGIISRSSSSSRHSSKAGYGSSKESKRSRTTSKKPFPPPISCIGKTGKPWVYFESYRQDGRFILQEVRIPTQEFLHSCREDGRLRMQLIQSDDDTLEFEDDDDDDDEDDDDDDFASVEE